MTVGILGGLRPVLAVGALFVLAAGGIGATPAQAADPADGGGAGDAVFEGGREKDGQSPAFMEAKLELRVWRDADGIPRVHDHPADLAPFMDGPKLLAVAAVGWDQPPDIEQFDTRIQLGSAGFAVNMVEPPSSGTDNHGDAYTDHYYPNFCGPGAAAVAIHEWRPNYTEAWSADDYVEPSYAAHHVTTYWWNQTTGDHRLRSYLMHLAEYVKPTGWATRGMVSFSDTDWDASTGTVELKGAMNWEVSDHASNWQDYYYTYHSKSTIGSKSQLMGIVMNDVGNDDVAVVFNVHTATALGWSVNVNHSIAILGYDYQADEYYYVDTCGYACSYHHNTNGYGRWIDAADIWTGLIGAVY
jgi:hypothetical protein